MKKNFAPLFIGIFCFFVLGHENNISETNAVLLLMAGFGGVISTLLLCLISHTKKASLKKAGLR